MLVGCHKLWLGNFATYIPPPSTASGMHVSYHFLNTTPLVCAHCVFGFELTRVNLAHQLLSACMCVTTIVQAQRQQQRQGGLRVGTHG